MLFISAQVFAQNKLFLLNEYEGGVIYSISPNGKWVSGPLGTGVNMPSYLWSVETQTGVILADSILCEARHVSNNGVIAGVFHDPSVIQDTIIASGGYYKDGQCTVFLLYPDLLFKVMNMGHSPMGFRQMVQLLEDLHILKLVV